MQHDIGRYMLRTLADQATDWPHSTEHNSGRADHPGRAHTARYRISESEKLVGFGIGDARAKRSTRFGAGFIRVA